MTYQFYGWQQGHKVLGEKYQSLRSTCDLYDALSELWCAYTCAPRLRHKWSKENKTCGQCSITAFLVQDVFGGEVYGVLRPDGNYHCFNVVDDYVFDLTSEQFHGEKLCYDLLYPQSRTTHFAKTEKKERYHYLKKALMQWLSENEKAQR